MVDLELLQNELKALPKEKQLALAHWLLDSLVDAEEKALESSTAGNASSGHPLLRWAGMFSGGPGDTAEKDEAILSAEIDKTSGWSTA